MNKEKLGLKTWMSCPKFKGFVGWAIYSRKQFVTNQIALNSKKENVNKDKLLGWMFEMDVLQEMATHDKDVKSDIEYMVIH